jgi:DNA-directed RNA polymerase specialized sigma24 family protein
VDRNEALHALPSPYGEALRLRDEGARFEVISEATGVPVDAVATLLEVGARKLAALLAGGSELGM